MISQEFMMLLDDISLHHHTDFEILADGLLRLKSEWRELQYDWFYMSKTPDSLKLDGVPSYTNTTYKTRDGIEYVAHPSKKTLLFNMSRRGYELIAMLEDTYDVGQYIDAARRLHEDKNAGYSGSRNEDPWSNFREIEKFGISAVDGCLTRLSDKYVRFFNILSNPEDERVGEKLTETLMDFSAYCLILICLLDERSEKEGLL